VTDLREPRPELAELEPYDAREVDAEVKLHANENPANLPRELVSAIADRLPEFDFNRYPDPMCTKLRHFIAEGNGVEPGNVLVGNGGDELIFDLMLAWGGPGRTILDLPPTFSMYAIDAQVTGTGLVSMERDADFQVDSDALLERVGRGDVDIVVVANPNNPTGTVLPETLLIDLLRSTDALVLVDEAYFEFSRQTMRPHLDRHKNLVILRTFSKAFSLAGMRVGYLLGHEEVVSELSKVRQPYSVNRFSQYVASLVYRERMSFEKVIGEIIRERDALYAALAAMPGVVAFPSEANFVLLRVEHAAAVWRDLLHGHSILVRDFSSTPGLEDCLRVTVGTAEECDRFLVAMEEILASRRAAGVGGRTGNTTEGG
jgi:histidinol-phosphate aminotransferase